MALAFAGVVLRFYKVDVFPGINGDELVTLTGLWDVLAGTPVDLVTPTGHIVSPFYTGLNLPFVFLEPSAWLARAPAVLAGLLLIGAYALTAGRVLGRQAYFIGLALLSCLPWLIAMSRISWEPALTPLFAWLVLYLALRGSGWGTLVALACAVINQAVAVFLLPIAVLVYLAASPDRGGIRAAFAAAMVVLPGLIFYAAAKEGTAASSAVSGLWLRLTDVQGMGRFTSGFGNLLSGAGVAEGFSEPVGFGRAASALLIAVLCMVAWGVMRQPKWVALLVGVAASGGLLYLAAGATATAPGYERYALFLAVPTCVLVAASLDAAAAQRVWASAVAAGLSLCLLASFLVGYIGGFERTGGALALYRTASEGDPKLKLVSIIEAAADRGLVTVVADGWFMYWSASYVLGRNPNVELFHRQLAGIPVYDAHHLASLSALNPADRTIYGLAFPDSELLPLFAEAFPNRVTETAANANDGQPAALLLTAR